MTITTPDLLELVIKCAEGGTSPWAQISKIGSCFYSTSYLWDVIVDASVSSSDDVVTATGTLPTRESGNHISVFVAKSQDLLYPYTVRGYSLLDTDTGRIGGAEPSEVVVTFALTFSSG